METPPAILSAKAPTGTVPSAPITGGLLEAALWAERFAERPDLGQGPARLVGFRRNAIDRLRATLDVWPVLVIFVTVIGGIYAGIFTPTEAAIAACFYALVLGLLVYRTLTWRRFLAVSFETIETTSVVLFIVAGASIFAWILTSNRVTEEFASLILTISENPWIVLLLVNLILIVAGCFLETVAAITILVPVLLPIVTKVGVDPVHFGVIMVLNLMIGLLTPPIGMVLYVLSRVSGVPFERCVASTSPFLIPLVLVLLLVTFFPGWVMWLPTMFYR